MKRIAYFDNAKGILIIFIILAHVLSLCSKYYNYSDGFLSLQHCLCYNVSFLYQLIFNPKEKHQERKEY